MVYLRFRAWLQELDETAGGIGAVYFEEVRRHLGTAAAHAYGGYLAHLTAWAEALKLPYEGVPVGTIKRHATGKGNAAKEEVIAAIRARGFDPKDDNEADALALLRGRSRPEAGDDRARVPRARRRDRQPAPAGVRRAGRSVRAGRSALVAHARRQGQPGAGGGVMARLRAPLDGAAVPGLRGTVEREPPAFA